MGVGVIYTTTVVVIGICAVAWVVIVEKLTPKLLHTAEAVLPALRRLIMAESGWHLAEPASDRD